MSVAHDIIRPAEAEICRPWLRHILSHADWANLTQAALAEPWTLLAHWADTQQTHALFLDPAAQTIVAVSTNIAAGRYPALSTTFPGAVWYERVIHDLWGHVADGGIDLRPWLDHGHWPQTAPMALRQPATMEAPPLRVQSVIHPSTAAMVLPLGPVWGRLNDPAHLRLTLDAAAIRRVEAQLGFSHKGTLTLIRGKTPRAACRFAARVSADATVAHAVAFAQATEAALDVPISARAATLRIAMMELERIAVHLDNLAEVARLADAGSMRTSCGLLRENLLRATDAAFGHRLMMDCVVPGGVATDIAAGGQQVILRALGEIASRLNALHRVSEGSVLATRLTGLGRATAELVTSLAVGGVAGRASGRGFDVRTMFSPDYAQFAPRLAIHDQGDAAARQHLRLFEIGEGLRLAGAALDRLPQGPATVALPQVSGEGIACAESAHGDVWHWLRLDHGQIAAAFIRDPGWALWPAAERVMETAHPDDAGLIRASLALSAPGMDL